MTYTATHHSPHHVPPAYRQHRPSPTGLIVGVGLILAAVVLSVVLLSDRGSSAPVRVGAAMPDFTLNGVTGEAVHLADYKGQVVLVNAWATWCPPCKAEMPTLDDFYRSHHAQGFQLLAINSGDSQAEVASFIAQTQYTFPVLLDSGENVLNRLGVRGLPTSFVVGRDGLVKVIHIGEFLPQDLQAEVAPLLQ